MSLKRYISKKLTYFNPKVKQLWSPLAYYMASELFHEILTAVNYLHTKINPKVIHRNIKPTNILLKPYGQGRFIKITDFCTAVYHGERSQSHSQGAGTERYMAPEVKVGRKYNERADVYSLGIMAQELFNFDLNTVE